MSDFPTSECPRIPWRQAVQRVPLGNTKAPGPPVQQHVAARGKKQKSCKLAANLSGGGSSGPERSTQKLVTYSVEASVLVIYQV